MGQCCGCCGGDEKQQELEDKRKREEDEAGRKKSLMDADTSRAVEIVIPNRPKGSHRDRIIALFAKYEPEKLPLIDPWMQKLGGPRRSEYYIKDFCNKHNGCAEPKSKSEPLEECLLKYYEEKEDFEKKLKKKSSERKEAVEKKTKEVMAKFSKLEPGKEGPFFEEIFGPGKRELLEQEDEDLSSDLNMQSSFAAGEALKKDADEILKRIAEEEEERERAAQLQKQQQQQAEEAERNAMMMKKKVKKQRIRRQCTCDKELKDRILAMLIEYEPENLDQYIEEEHFYDSESGAELLYSLIEKHGEEPETKHGAVINCYRSLFEQYDPHRLKSLPTLVGAAMAASDERRKMIIYIKDPETGEVDQDEIEVNGLQQAVVKMLRSYGVTKPLRRRMNNRNSGGTNELTGAFLGSQPNSAAHVEGRIVELPPKSLRDHHLVHPWATTMKGEIQEGFSYVPIPDYHLLTSNYEKARRMFHELDPELKIQKIASPLLEQKQKKSKNQHEDPTTNATSAIDDFLEEILGAGGNGNDGDHPIMSSAASPKELEHLEHRVQREQEEKKKLIKHIKKQHKKQNKKKMNNTNTQNADEHTKQKSLSSSSSSASDDGDDNDDSDFEEMIYEKDDFEEGDADIVVIGSKKEERQESAKRILHRELDEDDNQSVFDETPGRSVLQQQQQKQLDETTTSKHDNGIIINIHNHSSSRGISRSASVPRSEVGDQQQQQQQSPNPASPSPRNNIFKKPNAFKPETESVRHKTRTILVPSLEPSPPQKNVYYVNNINNNNNNNNNIDIDEDQEENKIMNQEQIDLESSKQENPQQQQQQEKKSAAEEKIDNENSEKSPLSSSSPEKVNSTQNQQEQEQQQPKPSQYSDFDADL